MSNVLSLGSGVSQVGVSCQAENGGPGAWPTGAAASSKPLISGADKKLFYIWISDLSS